MKEIIGTWCVIAMIFLLASVNGYYLGKGAVVSQSNEQGYVIIDNKYYTLKKVRVEETSTVTITVVED